MRTGFVGKIGPRPVERLTGCLRTNSAIDTSKPPTGGGHTTEGGWTSALSVFRSRLTAPHLMVERKRVGQCVPFGEMAASFANPAGGVETNRWCRIQIEVVAFSQDKLWLPHAETVDTLAHIIVWADDQLQVPMKRPFVGDDLGPKPWATTSYARRKAGKWGKTAGWFMHVEIPENSHWDMGMYRWSVQMNAALELASGVAGRTLMLRTPHMKGPDVRSAQKLLRDSGWGNFRPGVVDGEYGMTSAQATWRAKHFLGYPKADINTLFGPALREFLEGKRKLPAAYRRRRLTRVAAARSAGTPEFSEGREIH
jgi:hypothetical protein